MKAQWAYLYNGDLVTLPSGSDNPVALDTVGHDPEGLVFTGTYEAPDYVGEGVTFTQWLELKAGFWQVTVQWSGNPPIGADYIDVFFAPIDNNLADAEWDPVDAMGLPRHVPQSVDLSLMADGIAGGVTNSIVRVRHNSTKYGLFCTHDGGDDVVLGGGSITLRVLKVGQL